ncbi:MAG: hypothetical protein ACLPTB_06250 [Acidimicrobiales bacterium]
MTRSRPAVGAARRAEEQLVERILSGAAGDSTPAAWAAVAAMLGELRETPIVSAPDLRERETVASIVSVVRASEKSKRSRPALLRRGLTPVIVAGGVFVGSTIAAAATDNLPAPMQRALAHAVGHIGIDLPTPQTTAHQAHNGDRDHRTLEAVSATASSTAKARHQSDAPHAGIRARSTRPAYFQGGATNSYPHGGWAKVGYPDGRGTKGYRHRGGTKAGEPHGGGTNGGNPHGGGTNGGTNGGNRHGGGTNGGTLGGGTNGGNPHGGGSRGGNTVNEAGARPTASRSRPTSTG